MCAKSRTLPRLTSASAKKYCAINAVTRKPVHLNEQGNQLGRVVRDVERKITIPDVEMQYLLEFGNQLLTQKRTNRKRLYSIHEPQVECIGKDKAHKKFEFGTKVGLVIRGKSNWIVGGKRILAIFMMDTR